MKWYRADELPKEYEGMWAWKYIFGPGPVDPLSCERVPFGYSREPHHCKGVYYAPMVLPLPPLRRKDD